MNKGYNDQELSFIIFFQGDTSYTMNDFRTLEFYTNKLVINKQKLK